MKTSAPYRARCSNQGDVNFCGYNHKRNSETVDAYAISMSLTPLPLPKENLAYASHTTTTCDCGDTNTNGTADHTGVDWGSVFFQKIGTVGEQWQGTPQDLLTLQTFTKGGRTDLSQCHKYGFKNVAGRKQWHGMFPLTSHDNCGGLVGEDASQTKYLSVTYTAHLSDVESGGYESVVDLTGAVSVDKTTGLLSSTVNITGHEYDTSSPENKTFTGYGAGTIYDTSTHVTTTYDYGLVSMMDFFVGSGGSVCALPIVPSLFFGDDGHGHPNVPLDGIVAWWAATYSTYPGYTALPAVTDITSYSGSASWTPIGSMVSVTIDLSWSISATQFKCHMLFNDHHILVPSAPGPTVIEFGGTDTDYGAMQLSDPYTASDVKTDVETNLLVLWDLTDDKQYPWRKDKWTCIAPLVIYREVQSNVSPFIGYKGYVPDMTNPITDVNGVAPFGVGWIPTYTGRAWFDPTGYAWIWKASHTSTWADSLGTIGYDGHIIGAPLPAGYFGWFDFYFDAWRFCKIASPGFCTGHNFLLYEYEYGGTLSTMEAVFAGDGSDILSSGQYYNFLPLTTTHATNTVEAMKIPRGGMIDTGPHTNGAILILKWAEARCRPYQSYNFARPCGDDAYAIDEATAQCFWPAYTPLTLGAPLPSLTGRTVLVAYTDDFANANGIYTGCTQTPNGGNPALSDLTLGTKIADLPAGYTHLFSDQFKVHGGFAGILKWPTAPACSGYWDDDSFKGDFRYGGWFENARTSVTTFGGCQAACLPQFQCHPSVICFSPNGEVWPSETITHADGSTASVSSGITKWFGASGLPAFTADGVYGSRVQANAEFAFTDLLYQTPLFPCPVTGPAYKCTMNLGGSCPDDNLDGDPILLYYPPDPLIEARCDSTVLAGPSRDQSPPALPTIAVYPGMSSNITWPTMTKPSNPSSDPYGQYGWDINTFSLPLELWTRYANERTTINADPLCRFVKYYEANFPPAN